MAQTVEFLFDTGLERYKAGEEAASLIPVFKEVCDRAPETSSAWICLSWLYLLDNQPRLAAKAARRAVKLNPQDPQARINLAMSMLEIGEKGLRPHIDMAKQLIFVNEEWEKEINDSIADGLSRKPDWQSLQKVKTWLSE
ncbi:tetratricopeptide repeat protein [Nodularia harveyana UHCC-0300]|uniref:Tetratricopeptide repeat protein n=1 Tax=Nodularia harveyana UHCC-0300 TaxID=2974287 RepID=A0ABU5UCE0_9CYAN|nr:tetratricopeptide repeat protein [Nodularia harveyana]MEA5580111.1 tetratricopeptide repeat protein [Nodularia harveyana UHCC-0300]